MAGTPFGPWKIFQAMGSSSHWRVNHGARSGRDRRLVIFFSILSSINIGMVSVLNRIAFSLSCMDSHDALFHARTHTRTHAHTQFHA